jgi:hypothetical protein
MDKIERKEPNKSAYLIFAISRVANKLDLTLIFSFTTIQKEEIYKISENAKNISISLMHLN